MIVIAAIYNHYVTTSCATFDERSRSLDEQRVLFQKYRPFGSYRMLVAEVDGRVVGMASTNQYRDHPAFRETAEVSVYVAPHVKRRGVGSALYSELFKAIRCEPLHLLVAGIALPNDGSVELHKRFGFVEVGIFDEYAIKNGHYISSVWMQKKLIREQTSLESTA